MRIRWTRLSFVVGCAATACSSSQSNSGHGGAGGTGGGANAGGAAGTTGTVTWSEHIAPLAFRECVGCHREGGIGPFSLTTYAAAAPLAGSLAEETKGRWMPPMPADNSGSCNTYSNARWLSDAEIALFDAWYRGGAPEGDRTKTPALPAAPMGLDNPSVVLDTGVDYTPPADKSDDYRCFMIDSGITSDTFLVAYQVIPGDAREVHHAIVYQPNSDDDVTQAVALDAAEAGPGYTCFGGPGVDADPRVLWAPGGSVITLPANTGLPLKAGRKLILQVHYNLASGSFPDRTSVRLKTSDSVTHAATYLAVADTKMSVAPGQLEGTTTRTLNGTNTPLVIYGALPHMHTLGTKLHVDATTKSGSTCLVNVDKWDFHWQNAWWYETPLSLDLFKNVTITCTYDTRNRTTPVTWGEGTADEMCLSYFYATAP